MESKYTVLLVDDEPNVLRSLTRVLRKEPYQVTTAESGKAALEIIEKQDVHLVISDMRMPGMTGAELLTLVNQKHPEIVRIVLSGHADLGNIFEAIKTGDLYKYITKPVEPIELKVVIQKGLEKYSLESENRRLTEALKVKNRELSRINEHLEACVMERTADLTARDKILEYMLNYHPLDEVLDYIAGVFCDTYSVEGLAVYLRDGNGNKFLPKAARGRASGAAGEKLLPLLEQEESALRNEFSAVCKTGQPRRASLAHPGSRGGTITGYLHPILYGGEALGVLEVDVSDKDEGAVDKISKASEGFQKLAAVAINDHRVKQSIPEMNNDIDGLLKDLGE